MTYAFGIRATAITLAAHISTNRHYVGRHEPRNLPGGKVRRTSLIAAACRVILKSLRRAAVAKSRCHRHAMPR
jgi:hypothetical protein